MYLGRYQLGEKLRIAVQCRSSQGSPSVPIEHPVAKIWSASARVANVTLLPVDRYQVTGHFGRDILLGSGYATGRYIVCVFYTTTLPVLRTFSFEIAAGGNADGAVKSLAFWQRPEAAYLVSQLDSGKLVQGRNPELIFGDVS